MTPLAAIFWGPEDLAATVGPAGLAWRPFAEFAADPHARDVRLAYFGEDCAVRALAAHTADGDIEAAFGAEALVAVERLPAGAQATALPAPTVERLWQTVAGLGLLTAYPSVLRGALLHDGPPAAGGRLPSTLVVHGAPRQPWMFVFRGALLVGMRPLSADTVVDEVTQALGALEFDPALDAVVATPAEAEQLEPLLPVRRFDLADVLRWLATVPAERLPRFAPSRQRERERLAAAAPRRRLLLGGAVAGLGLVMAAGGAGWLGRLRADWRRHELALARQSLEDSLRDLRRRNVVAVVRARQPRWGEILLSLARACPPGFALRQLEITGHAGRRWDIRAVGRAVTDRPADTLRAVGAVSARLQAAEPWRRAAVAPAYTGDRVGVVITLSV